MTQPKERDDGPDGEAFRSRPFVIAQTGAVSTGSATPGRVVEAKRMMDALLIDRMAHAGQLSDRQYEAARTLYVIWTDAGLNAQVTGRLLYVSDEVHDDDDGAAPGSSGGGPAPLEDGESWRDRWNRIMRGMDGLAADLLTGLMQGRHPSLRLHTVQGALDRLADDWGYEAS